MATQLARPTLRLPLFTPRPSTMRWIIERSHLVTVPTHIDANGLVDLRSRVQRLADDKHTRSDRPPIGPLTFRYELDDNELPIKVFAFFTDRHNKPRRFMRLVKAS